MGESVNIHKMALSAMAVHEGSAEWTTVFTGPYATHVVSADGRTVVRSEPGGLDHNLVRFIGECDPKTINALLQRVEALEGERDQLKRELEQARTEYEDEQLRATEHGDA